jgi:hypothetical protein
MAAATTVMTTKSDPLSSAAAKKNSSAKKPTVRGSAVRVAAASPLARGEQRHGLSQPPEPAQAVLARRLRDRAGRQEEGALGDGVRDHVERRPARTVGTSEAVHRHD